MVSSAREMVLPFADLTKNLRPIHVKIGVDVGYKA